jgi:hypothetical protein
MDRRAGVQRNEIVTSSVLAGPFPVLEYRVVTIYSEGIAVVQNGRSFLDSSRSCLICRASISTSCFGRRFCGRHQPRYKVRTVNQTNGQTEIKTDRGKETRSSLFRIDDFLSLLPDTCAGAVLRELITSKPPVVPQHELAGRPGLLREFEPETIRKTVDNLINQGLVEYWGESKFGNVLVFSSLASWRYRRELRIDESSTAIYRLNMWQGTVPKKLPDDLAKAFRHLRWTVDCSINSHPESSAAKAWTIEEAAQICRVTIETIEQWIEQRKLDPAPTTGPFVITNESLRLVQDAQQHEFDQELDQSLDDPRSNPYFNANDRRHDFADIDQAEAPRCQGEPFDGRDEGIAAMSMSPVSLAIAAESFGDHAGMFATQLIGTTRAGWSTVLEPFGDRGYCAVPDACGVCGYGLETEDETPRTYRLREACLGCLRSGMDRPPYHNERPLKEHVRRSHLRLRGGVGESRLEAQHA